MLKKVIKPLIFILLVFVIIVIGDDETRFSLKRTAKRLLKPDARKV